MSAAEKMARIPVKIEQTAVALPASRNWIRVKWPATPAVARLKAILREQKLHTVCGGGVPAPTSASALERGTATFMIMGDVCTRRCPFCDVAHGRPTALDAQEPRTSRARSALWDSSTSSSRRSTANDLRDGGAGHFVACIRAVRTHSPQTRIEVLVPDFRGRMDVALALMEQAPPDVFNHNLETIPRLYRKARPGADYRHSLELLRRFKQRHPRRRRPSRVSWWVSARRWTRIREVMRDLRAHDCDMLTIGQYLQPTRHHLAVERYVTPEEFAQLAQDGYAMGFTHVAERTAGALLVPRRPAGRARPLKRSSATG
jgi:lipoic acid synthetase